MDQIEGMFSFFLILFSVQWHYKLLSILTINRRNFANIDCSKDSRDNQSNLTPL